jgi:hypothetical protein
MNEWVVIRKERSKKILKSISSLHSSKTIKNRSKRDISAGPMLRFALSDLDLSYLLKFNNK